MAGLHAHVENYKAIKSADIELADLTVLAGVNASGKSTIARLFHRLVCIEANFERYAADVAFFGFFNGVLKPLRNVVRSADFSLFHRLRRIESAVNSGEFKSFEKSLKFIRQEIANMLKQQSVATLLEDKRLLEALDRDNGNVMDGPTQVSQIGVIAWIEAELNKIEAYYTKITSRGEGSAALFLVQRIKTDYFNPLAFFFAKENGTVLRVTDDEVPILDTSDLNKPFKPIFTPRQSLYIAKPSVDMPTILDKTVELNGIEYEKHEMPESAINLRIEDLLGGAVNLPKNTSERVSGDEWQYSLSDNSTIPIAQCADGIKSLSTILMLDKCGLLQSDSLLVIDEPEVHLHPRWVVEMARVLVSLAKYRKVRVLVTTHSPDMVHALRDFAANEDFGSNTCFYLAKEDSSCKGMYNYDPLAMNIGPIFTVFNQAKDCIASISKDIREGSSK